MFRTTRLTDYGIVLMGELARLDRSCCRSTKTLAHGLGLPVSTVSKVLKLLAKAGLLVSHRGASGGYTLARAPRQISMADLITALEGPLSMTGGSVSSSQRCPIGKNWQLIDNSVRRALSEITLERLTAMDALTLSISRKGK
jgi:FeS assembly SUF system regulator